MSGSAQNRTRVPLPVAGPASTSSAGTAMWKSWFHSRPSRLICTSTRVDRALTTEMPTPCRPPETAYESESNLPPACNWVMTTWTVGMPDSCISTGIPRPSSTTSTPPSSSNVTLTPVAWPAIASSTELSTTSQIRWCRPRSPVEPMYMPGRSRTASRPSRTVIDDAP